MMLLAQTFLLFMYTLHIKWSLYEDCEPLLTVT